jgi:hypothetical protein
MSALLLAVLLLGDPPAAPPPSPEPLAADKKREKTAEAKAKRVPAKKTPPAKVLTNDDLEKARQGGAAVSMLAADGVEPAPVDVGSPTTSDPGGGDVTEKEPRTETNWRREAEASRSRITNAVELVEQIEQRLALLRNDLQPQDPMNPFREQTRQAEIKAETERLEEARARLAAARQHMSDLEEEARKAGAPPGWLREP